MVGAFPPPVNGYAVITGSLEQILREHRHTIRLDISPGIAKRGPRYHVTRLMRVGAALASLVRLRVKGPFETYIATESRFGLAYTLVLALTAKALGSHIYLHHHVFRYIESRSHLMRALTRLTRRASTHIFLCSCMNRRFGEIYPQPRRSVVISNLAFVPRPEDRPSRRDATTPLIVSHLSNLTREKGLHEFLALAEAAAAAGLRAKFLLAGPVMREADDKAIEKTARKLSDTFEYRGPLFGEAKERFYRETDIFVFPTTYENEAQPIVVFEALIHGCKVLAYERGCIAEQIGDCGWLIARNENFVRAALPILLSEAEKAPGSVGEIRRRIAESTVAKQAETLGDIFAIFDATPSVRRRLNQRQRVYDFSRYHGGALLECAFGSAFVSDAQQKMTEELRIAAPYLRPVLQAQFPRAYRERGLIFIHVPKNAGTAINHALYGRSFSHFPASFLRSCAPELFARFPSVALLRDPVERAVSAYRHIRHGGGPEVRLHPRSLITLASITSFESFLGYLDRRRGSLDALEFVLRPQSYFVCDHEKRPIVTELFVMGHHDEAFAALISAFTPNRIIRRNVSAFPSPAPTAAQRRFILELYAEDAALIERVVLEREGSSPSSVSLPTRALA